MTSLSSIKDFLEPKELAIAGVSRNPKKFGRMAYEHLKKGGFKCYPVNPHVEGQDDDIWYRSVDDLPENVDRIFIVTPPEHTAETVRKSLDKGIRKIWIQQRSDSSEALDLVKDKDVNLIHNKCIFMYAEPVTGGHAFHRFISRLFGSYPR